MVGILQRWREEKRVVFQGANESEAIDVSNFDPVWLYLPGLAGTAITFQTRIHDEWVTMESGGNPISHAAQAGAVERIPSAVGGVKEIRLVSNASETLEGVLICTT